MRKVLKLKPVERLRLRSARSTGAMAAVVLALALVASACGSSGGSSGSTTSHGGNNSDPSEGVTATSITVGGILTATGAGGFTEADAVVGARAYFNQVNASGGVDGRKINFLGMQDDQTNSARDVQIVQQLVQQKDVFAVVPVQAIAFTGGAYLGENNIPFIGLGSNPNFCSYKSGYGVSGCAAETLNANSQIDPVSGSVIVKLSGGKAKTVFLSTDANQAGSAVLKPQVYAMEAAGLKVTGEIADVPLAGVADYSPYARQIMTSNHGGPPDAVLLINGNNNVLGLRSALKAAGYKGLVLDEVSYGPASVANAQTKAELQGAYVEIGIEPYSSTNSYVQTMLSEMRKVGGANFQPDEWAAYAYWDAAEFVAMLKKVGPDLTRARFNQIINSGFTFSVPGVFGTTTFPADHTSSDSCESVSQLEGTTWTDKVNLTCVPTVPIGTLPGAP